MQSCSQALCNVWRMPLNAMLTIKIMPRPQLEAMSFTSNWSLKTAGDSSLLSFALSWTNGLHLVSSTGNDNLYGYAFSEPSRVVGQRPQLYWTVFQYLWMTWATGKVCLGSCP